MGAHQSQAVTIALRMILQGCSGYVAAKACGLAPSTVYRACKRHQISLDPPKGGKPQFQPLNSEETP